MTWTRETPMEPGWYWFRGAWGDGRDETHTPAGIALICRLDSYECDPETSECHSSLMALLPGDRDPHPPADLAGFTERVEWWAGPIEPPE